MRSAAILAFAVLCCGYASAAATQTAEFQARIDAASQAGGGRVVVPAGEWTVGTLWLKSNVELHLEKGAVLERRGRNGRACVAISEYGAGNSPRPIRIKVCSS